MKKYELISSYDFPSLLREDAKVLVIESRIVNDLDTLFGLYRAATGAHYMGNSWDSLLEVLIDCEWTSRPNVVLVHMGLVNKLQSNDLAKYYQVLTEVVASHQEDSRRKGGRRDKNFSLIFVYSSDQEKKEIENFEFLNYKG